MKTQTFISIWKDVEGNMVNFERWSNKRLSTVVNKTGELMLHPAYRKDNEIAVAVEFYATPDGYTKEEKPSAIYNIERMLSIGKASEEKKLLRRQRCQEW